MIIINNGYSTDFSDVSKTKIDKNLVSTNAIIPIDFYNLNKSINIIEKSIKLKNRKIDRFKNLKFDDYFRR